MIFLNTFDMVTYFQTQALAIDHAIESAQKRGYVVDIPQRIWTEAVNYLSTVRYVLDLFKDEKLQRKGLVIVLYRMDSGNYELTSYIN